MIDRPSFTNHVKNALGRLHLPGGLTDHPLAELLSSSGKTLSAASLERTLIDAIHELRPREIDSHRPARWRLYRHLVLRHVEALRPDDVASQIGVSLRQSRRDHQQALETLVGLLWARYVSQHQLPDERPLVAEAEIADAVDEEVARIGVLSPPEPVVLRTALRDAIDTVAPLAKNRGVTIETQLTSNLRQVVVGSAALRQILLSLLSFGCEHAPASCIRITADNVGDGVEIGLAIEPHTIGWSVSVGERTTNPDYPVSFSIARRLAELQGGNLEVIADEQGVLRVALRFKAFYAVTVLVIDDNPDFVRLFRRYLTGSPFRVLEAKISNQATNVAAELHPDIVTLDVMMPSPDGWQILQRLKRRAETKDIPVVVCSVLRETALALSLGASACLAKPITQQALLECLTKFSGLAPAGSPAGSRSPHQRIDRLGDLP
jgi:CheY-like chemotaxis protein